MTDRCLAGLLDRAGETRPVTRSLMFGGEQGQQAQRRRPHPALTPTRGRPR